MVKRVEILQKIVLVINMTPKPESYKAVETSLNTFKSFRL